MWKTLIQVTRSEEVRKLLEPCKSCRIKLELGAFDEFGIRYRNSVYSAEAAARVADLPANAARRPRVGASCLQPWNGCGTTLEGNEVSCQG